MLCILDLDRAISISKVDSGGHVHKQPRLHNAYCEIQDNYLTVWSNSSPGICDSLADISNQSISCKKDDEK